jgi:hypothetical protein
MHFKYGTWYKSSIDPIVWSTWNVGPNGRVWAWAGFGADEALVSPIVAIKHNPVRSVLLPKVNISHFMLHYMLPTCVHCVVNTWARCCNFLSDCCQMVCKCFRGVLQAFSYHLIYGHTSFDFFIVVCCHQWGIYTTSADSLYSHSSFNALVFLNWRDVVVQFWSIVGIMLRW